MENQDLVGALDMSTAKRDAMDPLAQATGRFTKAGESEIDRRSTAVMAHAQLKGALETLCAWACT